jgi:hypothetical protein
MQPRPIVFQEMQPRPAVQQEIQPLTAAEQVMQPRPTVFQEMQPRPAAQQEIQPLTAGQQVMQPRPAGGSENVRERLFAFLHHYLKIGLQYTATHEGETKYFACKPSTTPIPGTSGQPSKRKKIRFSFF